MTNEQASASTAGASGGERCFCNEVKQEFERMFHISPDVRQHLANSRIEFLKAVRAVIDQRIEHLSAKGQQGSRIAVE